MSTQEKFTFFWNGPFSQWYDSPFTVDGVSYNCCEQYMMAKKAMLFGDSAALLSIMNSTSPKEQKAIGRKVRGFDESQWNAVVKDIVYRCNMAKFTQDPKLGTSLFQTSGTTLVEASPYDKIWGIGLKESDPRAQDRNRWEGKNWLGEILTQLRDDLLIY